MTSRSRLLFNTPTTRHDISLLTNRHRYHHVTHRERSNPIAIAIITSCGHRERNATLAKELLKTPYRYHRITIVNTNCHKVKIPDDFIGMI